jgi:hypothetical protein
MNWKETLHKFHSPTRKTIMVYVVLSIAFYFTLALTNVSFIPCMKKPIVSPEYQVEFEPAYCNIGEPVLGVQIEYVSVSYIVLFIVLVLVPYAVAVRLTIKEYKPSGYARTPPQAIPERPMPFKEPRKSAGKKAARKRAGKSRKRKT